MLRKKENKTKTTQLPFLQLCLFLYKENPTLGVGFRKAFSEVLKNASLGVKINFGSPTKFKHQGGTVYVFRLK